MKTEKSITAKSTHNIIKNPAIARNNPLSPAILARIIRAFWIHSVKHTSPCFVGKYRCCIDQPKLAATSSIQDVHVIEHLETGIRIVFINIRMRCGLEFAELFV